MRIVKVLWISRHDPLPAQIAELKRLFGNETLIVQLKNKINNAEEVVEKIEKGKFQYAVVVLPLWIIKYTLDLLNEKGIDCKLLYAKMNKLHEGKFEPCNEYNPDTDVIIGSRHFRFVKFFRIVAVSLILKDVFEEEDETISIKEVLERRNLNGGNH